MLPRVNDESCYQVISHIIYVSNRLQKSMFHQILGVALFKLAQSLFKICVNFLLDHIFIFPQHRRKFMIIFLCIL